MVVKYATYPRPVTREVELHSWNDLEIHYLHFTLRLLYRTINALSMTRRKLGKC